VRSGKKKAALAIAHNILVIVYHLLALGTCYEETRYDQWNPRQEAPERQRAIKALERLGYTVTVERAASSVGRRLLSASSGLGWPCVPKQRQSLSGSGVSTRSRLFRRNPLECGFSAILMDYNVYEITDGWESQLMQSEEPGRHSSDEIQTSAESLPQHAQTVPLVQTAPSAPRRRRNTRVVAQRRRQRLQELLQHHVQRPANP
jgi:hypothetical protein